MQIDKSKILTKSFIALTCVLVGTVLVVTWQYYSKSNSGRGGLETPEMPIFESDLVSEYDNPIEIKDLGFESDILSYQAYRVNQGDMISVIADNFGVTQDTIISVNNIRQSRLLQIGQYLKIPNIPGILYAVREDNETINEIAEKYKIDAQKCALVNKMEQTVSLSAGQTLFLPDAELDWVTRQEINGDLFLRPVKRYYLSSYYGWRNSPFTGARSFHSGIDMAAPSGTPIYASLEGKVTTVGYNETYGNYIILSHHSGYTTLYGHMSATLVLRGQYVTTSTMIGKVGSTGMSTGPHLHFTVFKNGRTVNPLNLLK